MSSKQGFKLELSTPGKVILFGEHSVVHHKAAIAAALDLRTRLFLTETDSGQVRLSLPAVEIEEIFSVNQVKEFFNLPQTCNLDQTWNDYLETLTDAFQRFCALRKLSSLNYNQRLSLLTFFHCFSLVTDFCPGIELRVETDLAVGSGVGSSASFSVAVSTAFLLYQLDKERRNMSDYVTRKEDGTFLITEELKKDISMVSLGCEKIIHGTPSGIDHNTVLHGSMLEFIRLESGTRISQIECQSLQILLVNTNISRNTKKLVENVRILKERHPGVVDNVLEAMGCVSKNAVGILRDLKTSPAETELLEAKLCELVTLNHELLRVLGVSHPALEEICNVARKYGLSAKLTGAGGGGYGFVYLPGNIEPEVVSNIQKELKEAGFTVTKSVIGGTGLEIGKLSS